MAAPYASAEVHAKHMAEDRHCAYTIKEVEIFGEGHLALEICDTCSYVRAECAHEKNVWLDKDGEQCRPGELDAGVTLVCVLCGHDGT